MLVVPVNLIRGRPFEPASSPGAELVRPVHPTLEESLMPDMVLLTDAELDLVAGGVNDSITQSNYSSIFQSAYASSFNSGAVSATASGSGSVAVAIGSSASATNLASVSQSNSVE